MVAWKYKLTDITTKLLLHLKKKKKRQLARFRS